MPPNHVHQIDSIITQLQATVSADEQYHLDRSLHRLLLESAGNRYITDLYERLSFDATRLLHMSGCGMESLEDQMHFMSAVRASLKDNDNGALEDILISHAERFRSRLMQALLRAA